MSSANQDWGTRLATRLSEIPYPFSVLAFSGAVFCRGSGAQRPAIRTGCPGDALVWRLDSTRSGNRGRHVVVVRKKHGLGEEKGDELLRRSAIVDLRLKIEDPGGKRN